MTVSGQLLHCRMGILGDGDTTFGDGCIPLLLVIVLSFILNLPKALWTPDNLDQDVEGISLLSRSVLKESKMSKISELDLTNGKLTVSKPGMAKSSTGTNLPFPVDVEALRNIDAIRDFLIQTVHDRAKGPTEFSESEKCMQTNTVSINCKKRRSVNNKPLLESDKSANKTMNYPFIVEVEAFELIRMEESSVFPFVWEAEEMHQDDVGSRNGDDLGYVEDDLESSTDYSDSENEPVPEDEFSGSYGSPMELRGNHWPRDGLQNHEQPPNHFLNNYSNEQRLEEFDNLMILSHDEFRIAGLPTGEMMDEFVRVGTLYSNDDDQVVPSDKHAGLPSP